MLIYVTMVYIKVLHLNLYANIIFLLAEEVQNYQCPLIDRELADNLCMYKEMLFFYISGLKARRLGSRGRGV